MAGSLALGEYLAGAVIALMLSGGAGARGLRRPAARARELAALLAARAAGRPPLRGRPSHLAAARGGPPGRPAAGQARRDRARRRPGRGRRRRARRVGAHRRVAAGRAAAPASWRAAARSTRGGPFELRAVATAAESTYAGIVRLVREAEASKAPFVRLADRYALVFLPLTLAVAGVAWALSGDPVRALAVLVVATPCPLILAAPVAIVAGVSRAAQRGVIVKGGRALEALAPRPRPAARQDRHAHHGDARARATSRRFGPRGRTRSCAWPPRSTRSRRTCSPRPWCGRRASRGLALSFPAEVTERPGQGIQGTVDGRRVALGKLAWIAAGRSAPGGGAPGAAADRAGGLLERLRGDRRRARRRAVLRRSAAAGQPRATLRALRRAGIERVVLVTGDRREVARAVGAGVGADLVLAERSPEEKVEAVRRRARRAARPSWSATASTTRRPWPRPTSGVAMGARGATRLLGGRRRGAHVDRLDRLAEALAIARRSRGIALQSVARRHGPLARRPCSSPPPATCRRSPAPCSRRRSTSP